MEDLRPAISASAARRGLRVERRRSLRRRALRVGAIAGVLLLLAAVTAGLVQAQQGVADLAGPSAPAPPLATACGEGGCWLAVFGHRVGVAGDPLRALAARAGSWWAAVASWYRG